MCIRYDHDTHRACSRHFQFCNQEAQLDWLPDEYPEYTPQIFSRADVIDEQRAAVLILLHSFAQSEQLARELASECLIGHTITRLFGPLRRYWIYSATRYLWKYISTVFTTADMRRFT